MALKITNSDDFVDVMGLLIAKQTEDNANQESYQDKVAKHSTFKIARISVSHGSGRPQVIFQGETVDSLKKYPYLKAYNPKANDWVLMAKVGSTYVILGNIV